METFYKIMETRLIALKEARCIKWHELAEELGITRQIKNKDDL